MRRRTFLKGGLLGAASVALGTDCQVIRSPPAPGLQVFSEGEAATLRAVAGRILAPLDAEELQVVTKIDALLAAADDLSQHDLKQLLDLLDSRLAGLIFDRRCGAFHELSEAAQDQALIAWRDSHLPQRRSGFQALQRLCEAVAYATPSVYPAIGYPGPPFLLRPDGTTVGGPSPTNP